MRALTLISSARRASRVRFAIALLVSVGLAGCARHYTPQSIADPYGLFSGIWHGLVFPYALLANILSWLLSIFGIEFLSDVKIVGRPNAGVLFYYVGFVMGVSTYGGGAQASRG